MESESPILNMRKSNKSNGQGAKEGHRHSPTPTGPWQIPPTPTSFKYQWALPALCFCWMRFATNIDVSRNLSAVNVHFGVRE